MENTNDLIRQLWELWESMAECGTLSIGPKFSKNYTRLKTQVEQKLNIHGVMQVLPIEFLEWYSGTTNERLLQMYERWKKEGNTAVASERMEKSVCDGFYYCVFDKPEPNDEGKCQYCGLPRRA